MSDARAAAAGEAEPVLVDACVAINVYATGIWTEIFAACGLSPVIAEQAAREMLWIAGDDGEPVEVALPALREAGAVEVWAPAGEELVELLSLAARLGDGEAACLAIAFARGLEIATDDRAARRQIRARGLAARLWTTPRLLRAWAGTVEADGDRIEKALLRVRERARYFPHREEPEYEWWASHDPGLPC